MFTEYETFILRKPLSEECLVEGLRGVILSIYGGKPIEYEVEFPDGNGGNLGDALTYTITADYMRVDDKFIDGDE